MRNPKKALPGPENRILGVFFALLFFGGVGHFSKFRGFAKRRFFHDLFVQFFRAFYPCFAFSSTYRMYYVLRTMRSVLCTPHGLVGGAAFPREQERGGLDELGDLALVKHAVAVPIVLAEEGLRHA